VDNFLGLARTELIFTGIQKGAQPGGLTQPQPGQTEPGIPYHVPSCWVPVGGVARRELTCGSGERSAGPVRESGFVLQSVLSCFLLICIVVFPVPFVCCSVKLPLSRPTSFLPVYFHSPPHCRGGGAAAWLFCCRRQPKPKQSCMLISYIRVQVHQDKAQS